MRTTKTLSLILSLGALAQAQTVNLTGKITNQAGKGIANAIVTLTPLGLKDTSGADGSYTLANGSSGLLPSQSAQSMNFRNGLLEINLGRSATVKVEVFDTKGARLNGNELQNTSSGIYRMDFTKMAFGTGICLIKVTVDQSTTTFRYAPMTSLIGSSNFASQGAVLARVAAATDSIKVTASGYKTKTVVATSLTSTIDVKLDTNASSDRWGGLNNEPIKSAGCGKALGVLPKSGTYKISTVSGRGEFIINIPTSYDKDKPYRLIFGNHCMGGSAIKVAGTDNGQDQTAHFYHIKTQADKENIPAIYIAMQGDGGGTWSLPNDSKFWLDVLKHVETNLCVDTTRVFVAGFSFGAMFSYVLSLEHPEKIRAVATYAPANYNMTQPTNRKIPIAYYQTTGTSDGTCPWVNNDAQKRGGKYTLLQHVEDNGCTGTPKIATGSTHVTTDFTGCKEGYPVKFSSFVGGHVTLHTDPGTSGSWIEKETWAFFKQF
ncbi:MAG: alpha/beta hydrolase [Fibrobacterota bacterium]|nr:alpha/beta hydrolase [Fibrobacterota bacterium]QQS03236.1 MAG: alpha/beta hydrolase [Fibrobacterota bacterium]